jgi:CubicO group peptidase (beta-lactamase class C family)
MKSRWWPISLVALAAVAYAALSPAIGGEAIAPYPAAVATRLPPHPTVARSAGALADVLKQATITGQLPSMSAAIASSDGLVWSASYGWADIEHRVAATPDSRYRTGSMAKPITAVAMMRLVERGLLDLDEPLGTRIEGLGGDARAITPRQLASHTAGVRHYTLAEGMLGTLGLGRRAHYDTVQAGLQPFIHDPLRFKPGTGFLYSTFGYSLLSRRLELAAGTPFPRILAEDVFKPCGMTATDVESGGPAANRVSFYRTQQGKFKPAMDMDTSGRIAGGGLLATAEDLAKFGQCTFQGPLLGEQARRMLATPVTLANGEANPQHYGLGWRIDDSTRLFGTEHPTRIIHHGGKQEGGAGFLLVVPGLGVSVAVMTNSASGDAREHAQETAYALMRAFASATGMTSARGE